MQSVLGDAEGYDVFILERSTAFAPTEKLAQKSSR
jgi:hypothetical protein